MARDIVSWIEWNINVRGDYQINDIPDEVTWNGNLRWKVGVSKYTNFWICEIISLDSINNAFSKT